MNYTIAKTTEFNEAFFKSFVFVKNEICKRYNHQLSEEVSSFQKLLSKDGSFDNLNHWIAVLVYKNSMPVLRSIIYYPNQSEIASIGFYESIDDDKEAVSIFSTFLGQFLKENSLKEIQGPIDGNFFFKYRFKLATILDKPFYSEIQNPPYYIDHFLECGFVQTHLWATLQFSIKQGLKHLLPFIQRKQRLSLKNLKIKSFDRKNWMDELRVLYDLFLESYKDMPNFTPIDFETFRDHYQNVRYLISEQTCFFVYDEGKPVAFLIAMEDPMQEIMRFEKSSKTFLEKLLLLCNLKLSPKNRLLIMYIGKIKNNKNHYGITLSMIEQLTKIILQKNYNEIFATFLMDGSKSYGFIPADAKVISTYGLFSKRIS